MSRAPLAAAGAGLFREHPALALTLAFPYVSIIGARRALAHSGKLTGARS